MKIQAAMKFLLLACLAPSWARADYRDDVGYANLRAALGAAAPTGAGVSVAQVEAAANDTSQGAAPVYAPDPGDGQFAGKSISFPAGNASGGYSSHATGVGRTFYGSASSMAPGINSVNVYEINSWLDSIATGSVAATDRRVANHSWVGSAGASNATALRLVDRLVYQQQYIQVVGMDNGAGPSSQPLLGSAYNVIAVGRTDGNHAQGSVAVDGTYVAGRARPDLVSPLTATSLAAPTAAAAAALLVQAGHAAPGLSHGSTTVSGMTIYNAERPETVKAALMAGADRDTANTGTAANIADYRAAGHQTANGLDSRYGAGQLDVFNSHQIIAAGEQEAGAVGPAGFDYRTGFGGAGGRAASYTFTATGGEVLSASLVWNLGVSNNANLAPTLHHLNLSLFDLTENSALVADSSSALDNTQNLWLALLGGHGYELRVSAADAANFSWGYALAWQTRPSPVPLPAAFWLFAPALAGLGAKFRR